MHFIVATKGTVRFLDKEGQLMHDGVRWFDNVSARVDLPAPEYPMIAIFIFYLF